MMGTANAGRIMRELETLMATSADQDTLELLQQLRAKYNEPERVVVERQAADRLAPGGNVNADPRRRTELAPQHLDRRLRLQQPPRRLENDDLMAPRTAASNAGHTLRPVGPLRERERPDATARSTPPMLPVRSSSVTDRGERINGRGESSRRETSQETPHEAPQDTQQETRQATSQGTPLLSKSSDYLKARLETVALEATLIRDELIKREGRQSEIDDLPAEQAVRVTDAIPAPSASRSQTPQDGRQRLVNGRAPTTKHNGVRRRGHRGGTRRREEEARRRVGRLLRYDEGE